MIKTVTINYGTKDFFGHDKLNSDVLDFNISARVIDRVVRAIASGRAYAAHFIHDDGSVDGIWTEGGDIEHKQLTYRHDIDEWNRDAVTKTTPSEFKRKMKAALDGQD